MQPQALTGAHPLPGCGWSRQAVAGPFGGKGRANQW